MYFTTSFPSIFENPKHSAVIRSNTVYCFGKCDMDIVLDKRGYPSYIFLFLHENIMGTH